MPPAPPPSPVHRRTIVFEAYEDGEHLDVVGTLRDERPWAAGTASVAHVHDLELRARVRTEDLSIVDAAATMGTYPHVECPAVAPAFAGLVGLRVGRGYTRAVQERFGGPRGCTHLEHLARSLGPVVLQAVTSGRAAAAERGEAVDLLVGDRHAAITDTCHVWASGGPAEQKLAAGWRPGSGPYPAPPVAAWRAEAAGPPRRAAAPDAG